MKITRQNSDVQIISYGRIPIGEPGFKSRVPGVMVVVDGQTKHLAKNGDVYRDRAGNIYEI